MPWLLWGFDRQTYARRELIIVDSSPAPWSCERGDVSVIPAPPGSNVPSKRNRALEAARGSVVAWFDDDDWQHPERLERLVAALSAGADIAGPHRSWFVDVLGSGASPHRGYRLLFNGSGFRLTVARSARFDERIRRGSDTLWMRALRAGRHRVSRLDESILSIWLCHDGNISNPRQRREFPSTLDDVKSALGPAWGADERLRALREQLLAKAETLHA